MENRFNIEQSFRNYLNYIGHPLDGSIQFDTTGWPRYSCPHSSDKHNQDVAYKAHSDGIPALKVKCHKCHPDVIIHKYESAKYDVDWSNFSKIKIQKSESNIDGLNYLMNTFKTAIPCENHDYFIKKHVKITKNDSFKIRSSDNALLCPIYSISGDLISGQKILQDGKKRFFKNTTPKAGFHILGSLEGATEFILAEGIATALTIRESLNQPVICVYGKSNFTSVSNALQDKYQHVRFKFICDLDADSGSEKSALNAISSLEVNIHTLVLPDFTIIPKSLRPEVDRSDFNDLFVLLLALGSSRNDALLEVKRQIEVNFKQNIAITGNANIVKPTPLPNSLKEVVKFDPNMLPSCIKDYVIDIANRQQCPIDFVAIAAVCGLAAVLGRKALMFPKQNDDWSITPNLWGAIIGRPSAMKTPSMKAALAPLYKLDADAAKQFEVENEQYDLDKEFSELNKTSAKDKAKKHIKDGNADEARLVLKDSNFTESPPIRRRIIVNDATVEKLGELLNDNPNGLVLVRDELSGWLAKLTKEEYQSDRSFYLECYDGSGRYVYDRIGRGTIDIENTTLSVIGGIQPSKISPLIRDAVRGTVDDGLVQRLQLAVWPDDTGKWEWNDSAPNKIAHQQYTAAFEYLHNLNFENETKSSFRFTNEAQKLFIQWMEDIQKTARADDIHPALESHLLKMPKTVGALALIFELLEEGKESVGEAATQKAIAWASYLRSHAERLYGIATNQGLDAARSILSKLNKLNKEFTAREILRKGWAGLTDAKVIEEGLEWLIDYSHLISHEIKPTEKGGRSTILYRKNDN